MPKTAIPFNVNHYVRVKLTPEGHRLLRKQHDEIYERTLHFHKPDYVPPKEDEDGWSQWQLHDLMFRLGSHCYNGCHVPFETNFEFLVEEGNG